MNGITFNGEKPLESAKNQPLTEKSIRECFEKSDKYPFEVVFKDIVTNAAFMPVSELNAFRRDVYGKYYELLTALPKRDLPPLALPESVKAQKNGKIAAVCTDLNGVTADIGILKADFNADFCGLTSVFFNEKYLYLPPYLTGAEIEKIKPQISNFDGVYCDGIYAFALCEELKKPLFAGTGLNISNRIGAKAECKYIALSKELTQGEAEKIATGNAFCLTGGALKVMDLIYCPFEKKCSGCDKRRTYTLTDEDDRTFTLRRYVTSDCRYELYNCVPLVGSSKSAGKLLDCSLERDAEKLIEISDDVEKMRVYYNGVYTRGHTDRPII